MQLSPEGKCLFVSPCWHVQVWFTVLDGRSKNGAAGGKENLGSLLTAGASCIPLSIYFMIPLHNEIHYFCYITDLVFYWPHLNPAFSSIAPKSPPSAEDAEGREELIEKKLAFVNPNCSLTASAMFLQRFTSALQHAGGVKVVPLHHWHDKVNVFLLNSNIDYHTREPQDLLPLPSIRFLHSLTFRGGLAQSVSFKFKRDRILGVPRLCNILIFCFLVLSSGYYLVTDGVILNLSLLLTIL